MESPYANYIVIDVETGGLLSKTKKAVFDVALTEVAVVAVDKSLNIVGQDSWLIRPYKDDLEYNPGAEEASGISKSMCIQQGEDIKEVYKKFEKFVKKYIVGNKKPIVVGHNLLSFDIYFIENFIEYNKGKLDGLFHHTPEDTIHWCRLKWTESTNFKLGTCCRNAGIELTEAHRALPDTIATAKLWINLMSSLRGVGVTSSRESSSFRERFKVDRFEYAETTD